MIFKKVKSNNYVCPYCFSNVDVTKAHYYCTREICVKMNNDLIASGERKGYLDANPKLEVDTERSLFLGFDPAGPSKCTSTQHIVRDSSGICDMCHRPCYKRICPECHNLIPPGIEEEDSEIFVMLGPKGVGKSHYMAVLINQLKEVFAPEFDANMSAATDETTLKYQEEYYKRLFEDKKKLPSTKSAEEDSSVREPMIYYLRFFENDKPKVYTLVFFDTAGEDLVSSERIIDLNLNSFIARSSGIVFLVDPLQIPYINGRIKIENKPPVGPDVNTILTNVTSIIRNSNKIRGKERIPIPLAVVLTKCDVLLKQPENEEEDKVLFGPEAAITIDRTKGEYDSENFEQIDVELEEYMRRTVSPEFTQQIKEYSDHCYFAVSALGSNPTGNTLTRGISPMRVEDPILWLLNRGSQN